MKIIVPSSSVVYLPTVELITVETHCHTRYSADCLMRPARMIEACSERGIDRLFITDHNIARGAFEMAEMAPDLVVPGQEILTSQGELLAFFINEEVPAHLSPMETIERLRTQGAVVSISHPFDICRRGHWQESELRSILPYVDAIEVFNARCYSQRMNERASSLAREVGQLGTVGSDAHSYREIGRATLQMPPFTGPVDFLASLRTASAKTSLSSPVIHLTSLWAKLVHTLN